MSSYAVRMENGDKKINHKTTMETSRYFKKNIYGRMEQPIGSPSLAVIRADGRYYLISPPLPDIIDLILMSEETLSLASSSSDSREAPKRKI